MRLNAGVNAKKVEGKMRKRKGSWAREPVKETESQWLEEGKELSRLIFLLPVLGLYVLWMAAVFKAQGLIPAGIASLGLVSIIWRWPEGLFKRVGAVLLLGIIVPASVSYALL